MRKHKVTMPPLHAGQDDIRLDPSRFKALPCGRRYGKTHLVNAVGNGTAIEKRLPVWWIWPTRPVAKEAWQGRNGLLDWGVQLERQGFPVTISRSDWSLTYPGGGSFTIRSADNPDHLVAAGLGLAIFDECGLHKVKTWEKSVRPALADHRGGAYFVGVPKGRQGLLWHAHRLGLDPEAKDWATFQRPTNANPLFSRAEWSDILADHQAGRLSDRYFRQEYLAEFIGDHGAVFENVVEVACAPYEERRLDGAYIVVGIDWGRTGDATVFSAADIAATPPRQVAIERIVGRSFAEQERRLASFCETWTPELLIPERNSLGLPLCERLAAKYPVFWGPDNEPGLAVGPHNKRDLIEQYAHAFRLKQIAILPDPTQIAEHQAYEVHQLTTGHMKFGAPTGEHDDTVMGGALWYSAVATAMPDWGVVMA